jgi:hypothetical protein
MRKTKSKKNSYLVFKRKEISFDVPDNFPTDKIPKFMTEIDFRKWYKKQGFRNLKIVYEKDYKGEPITNPFVLDLEENNEDYNDFYGNFSINKRIHTLNSFISKLNDNKHLIKDDLLDTLSAIDPIDFFNLLTLNLSSETYEKFKNALLTKYPKKTIFEILYNHLNFGVINKSSEQFIEFLYKEKIPLKQFNFLDFNFAFPEKLTDAIDNDDWGRFTPPFSIKKMELLLEMCDAKETKENHEKILIKLTNLIKSNSVEKMKLLLTKNILEMKTIKKLLRLFPNIPITFSSLLLSTLK